MNLFLIIALSVGVSTRASPPRGDHTMDGVDVKLLNQLLESAAAIVNNPENDLSKSSDPYSFRTDRFEQPVLNVQNSIYSEPRTLESKKVYSDGPFSDIPSDAFQLEHRKDFRHAKKDLSRQQSVPELVAECLEYFREGSSAHNNVITSICTEQLDAEGVGEFPLEDKSKPRSVQHSESCECCPHGHAGGREGSDRLLQDLVELFKPVGQRREWMVLNSKDADERMKTYVDFKK